MSKSSVVKLTCLGLLGAFAVALAMACGSGGVSNADYQTVKKELADQQAANQQLQQQAAKAATPVAGASGGGLIAAVKVTPAAPAPTPTPGGPPPPPRATAPASYYDKVGPYFIYAETLATTSPSKYNIASNISCTPSGVFARGQKIVFRYDIVDMATGKRLTAKDTDSVVKVVLPNGDESAGSWSQRGGGKVPDAPFMYSSNWTIPLDFPLGNVDYKITITKGGQTFTWKPPFLSSVALKEDTRPKVVE